MAGAPRIGTGSDRGAEIRVVNSLQLSADSQTNTVGTADEREMSMWKMSTLVAGAFLVLGVAAPAWAQDVDVSGKWQLTSEGPRGTQTSTITFQQEGTALSGRIETRMGWLPFEGGSVEGNTITFKIVRSMGERSMEMTYSGTVEGDTITGTMSTPRGETPWTAKRVD